MKRFLPLTLALCLLTATTAFADLEGSWTASIEEKRPDRIYMDISFGRDHQNGSTMELSRFSGLTAAQINATATSPVTFAIDREAGKATFEGTFRNGHGAGQFTFAGNRAYRQAIEKLGVKFDLDRGKEKAEDETLFTLTLFDVSTAFIRSMQAEGYKETLQKYLEMRIFNITPEYIREMRSLGFRNIDADELVATRIHKVTPQYIREMRAAGWDFTLEEYQSNRIFNVTPQFAEEMKKLGFANLSHDELTSFRIHKVTPEFMREMAALGYEKLDAEDLINFRIHRVTPEFIRELADAGYHNVPADKLVAMRINGIDAKYIKKMNQ